MSQKFGIVIGLIGAAGLVGCSTYSRKECLAMNWHQQGAKFALKGETVHEGLAHFANGCKDVPVDSSAFQSGFDSGLAQFCTPENIEKFATEGGRYKGTCPESAVSTKFMSQYSSGRETYLEKKVKSLKSELSDAESKLSRLESEVSSLKSDLRSCESKSP